MQNTCTAEAVPSKFITKSVYSTSSRSIQLHQIWLQSLFVLVLLFLMELRSCGDGDDSENVIFDQSITEDKINTIQEVTKIICSFAINTFFTYANSTCLHGWLRQLTTSLQRICCLHVQYTGQGCALCYICTCTCSCCLQLSGVICRA